MANAFERMLMVVAPQMALKRMQARVSATALMNYDGASRGRRTYGWKAPGTSGDAASYGSRQQLRNLSRDMIRNRPYARRAQAVVTGNVVGTGISVSVSTEDDAVKKQQMQVLSDHFDGPSIDAYETLDLAGLQRLVMDTVFADGEVLIRRLVRTRQYHPSLPLLFQLQVMEVDHLDTTKTANGANEIVDGVEFGPTGKIVAYHLYDLHPGDTTRWSRRDLESKRVAADQVAHIRRVERPGQMRGTPWLAPVMMTLGELADYQEAQILKQKIAAMFAAFVSAPQDGKAYDGQALQEMAPGAIVGLEPDQEVSFPTPPSVDGFAEFMTGCLRAIAVGLGITYESLAGDLSGVNFSSGRMGRMEMDRFVEVWQRAIIIAQFLFRVSLWTNDVWRLQQMSERKLPEPPGKLLWTAQKRPLIDPGKEVKAAVEEIEAGLTSLQRKQREFGNDPEVIARERQEDAARSVTEMSGED